MKTLLLSLLLIPVAFGQSESPEASQCRSQLIRMQIDNNAINSAIQNSGELQRQALPAIETFVASDAFRTGFIREYPLEPVGFPYDTERCEREKARDPLFRDVNCEDPGLCGSTSVSEEVKARLCFQLPCAFMMGSRMERCPSNAMARPINMTFPTPVNLRSLNLDPQNVTMQGNRARACFRINQMDINFGVGIQFDSRAVEYETIGLNNLNLNVNTPREICLSATVDMTKTPIVSGVTLEHTGGGPFVSDAMIDQALRGSTVSGLTGYTPQTLQILKLSGLPPLARHFRPTVENAIAGVLSSTFETTVGSYLTALNGNGPTRLDTPSDSMISELGVGNLMVRKYVDLLDCALMKRERVAIPNDHACFTTSYNGSSRMLNLRSLPTPERALASLTTAMSRNSNVTSESLRARLAGLEPRMRALNLSASYSRYITPIVNQIASAQSSSTLISGIELVSRLSDDQQLNVGVCLPEICDQQRPSTHAERNIPNCPIQAYVDINEMNNLVKAMYDSGRLCHRGRGDFVPQRNARGEIIRVDGFARGEGCVFAIEEDPDGLRCYLNGPPTLRYDQATRRYNVSLRTKECFRGGVFLGAGKIGGDIDFNIGFTPNICNGGDFCLENGAAEWSVDPRTARHSLRERDWLSGPVRRTIDSSLRDVVSKTLRIPMSSGSGPLSQIPVAPEGRVDMGDGYFGACLKIR